MQSGNGATHRNLELLLSDASSTGFSHVSRDGTSGKWSKIADISGPALAAPPTILGTSFNRDFHAVGVDKNHTLRQWAYSQTAKKWSQVSSIDGTAIDGIPGLTQSDNSDLVMVVKHADGSLNEVRPRPPFPLSIPILTPLHSGDNTPTPPSGPSPPRPSPPTSPNPAPSSNPTSPSTFTTPPPPPPASSTPSRPSLPATSSSSPDPAAPGQRGPPSPPHPLLLAAHGLSNPLPQ